MEDIDIKRTVFSVADFLDWQTQDSLELNPPFQRRSVWRAGAKSFLVDTVVRGLPTPLIFIRERIDLETLRHVREVIDGQQRLRTLIGFIDEKALADFEPERDRFTVRREHNRAMSGKTFKQLDAEIRGRILGYQFSTHVLPSSMEDRDILAIFQRLNSTGTPLNKQELRNAKYFGAFKTLMYQLAYEQLERWLSWQIFNEDQISRMDEVEFTSDLARNMLEGVAGRSHVGLNRLYDQYDGSFGGGTEFARRFRKTMDTIDDVLGTEIARTVFSGQVYFFTLFTFVYDRLYGLGSALEKKAPASLRSGIREALLEASTNFRTANVPDAVLDAVQRASADYGRRVTRLAYLGEVCDARRRH